MYHDHLSANTFYHKKSPPVRIFPEVLSNSIFVYEGIYDGQKAMVDKTDSARQEVMGVSSDDELTNMIKFQNAYNASSRYINVIDEMLEHLLSTLGA